MRHIQSLARGLKILDMLLENHEPQGVTDLAARLELDKSTVSRLLGTLEAHGYVQREKAGRRFVVGPRLQTLGGPLVNPYTLNEAARPYLVELAEQTGECAHIGVYAAGKAVVTDDVQAETSLLRVVGKTGRTIHLHNTAVGKSLIAFGDFPLPDALPAITPRTITDATRLQAHLADVCASGYAFDDEENEPGVRCLAAPVYDAQGQVIAALGLSGPTVRVTDAHVEALAAQVIASARAFSMALGYNGN